MAIFAIGDLHLSTSCDKPMDVFEGWHDYVARVTRNWQEQVAENDTVVLVGDTSWGMSLEQALGDFQLLDSLPGKKVLIKGNHDYWWSSRRQLDVFCPNRLKYADILHNSCVCAELALCGTRGWMLEDFDRTTRSSLPARRALKGLARGARGAGCRPLRFCTIRPSSPTPSGRMLALLREYGVGGVLRHLHGRLPARAGRRVSGHRVSLVSADHLVFRLKPLDSKNLVAMHTTFAIIF
jgi:predicted phosphohydrolase